MESNNDDDSIVSLNSGFLLYYSINILNSRSLQYDCGVPEKRRVWLCIFKVIIDHRRNFEEIEIYIHNFLTRSLSVLHNSDERWRVIIGHRLIAYNADYMKFRNKKSKPIVYSKNYRWDGASKRYCNSHMFFDAF
jgi:hypothetical protein